MSASTETRADILDGAKTAAALMGETFAPLRYVVEGLIPEGLTVIAGPPKAGKSYLVLGIAGAASTGGRALGHIPTGPARPVLYLALEDGWRRLKTRLSDTGTGQSHRLALMTKLTGGILDTVRTFMERHDGEDPVVIVDTLAKVMFMFPAANGETSYERDYRVMSTLKEIADAHPGSGIIVVHHTRKMDATDYVERIIGTQGIAGAADNLLVLQRRRGEADATLCVTSREAPEGEYAAQFGDRGVWTLAGPTLAAAAQAASTRRAVEGVGDRMADVIASVNRHPDGIGPKTVALDVGIDETTTRVYLGRAVEQGRIRRTGRGKYAPLPPVTSVASVAFDLPHEHPESNKQHSQHPSEGDTP
ncbi:AAA family ATPase [Sinomonas sp. P10A9]|uniref:AAA family ATPase n=1 Tax=Sinomonas puerhi TaxID=3238584 RepID=A0AB39L9K1_9MICC